MRLFFAIPLPPSVNDAVSEALRPLRGLAPGISWTRRANLHITLRFLGEVPEAQADALADAAAPWVRRLPPPPVRLSSGGAFPDARHARVLWIGADAMLGPLVQGIETSLLPFGVAPEPLPFVPHLTVGRVRHGRVDHVVSALRELGEVARFAPEAVVLYESHPSPEGVRYAARRTIPVV